MDDENNPFMQSRVDAALDEKAERPISKIMFDCPSGNNHIHLDHRHQEEHEVDVATAFEEMMGYYAFCPAGLHESSSINNTPPVYALIHGDNLFQTFVLNMVSAEELGAIPFGKGETPWLRKETIIPDQKVIDMSYLKALTWQPRRLTIMWDENSPIRRAYVQNGLNFTGNNLWLDPNVMYKKNKDGGWSSVKPELKRQLWRDAGSVVSGSSSIRSAIPIQNIATVWDSCPQWLDVELIGLITSNASVLGRINERLKLPRELFERDDLASEFRTLLESTELMFGSLKKQVRNEFCHSTDNQKNGTIADQAGELFLHGIHDVLFGSYLDELLADKPYATRISNFMDAMWDILDTTMQTVIDSTGDDVLSMKRQMKVRTEVRKQYFMRRKELLPQ